MKSTILVIAPLGSAPINQQLRPVISCVTENQLLLIKVGPQEALEKLGENIAGLQAVVFAGIDDETLFDQALAKTARKDIAVCTITADRSLIKQRIRIGLSIILDCPPESFVQSFGCYCLHNPIGLLSALNLIGEGEG